jgi:hypothetical protein
VSCGLRNGPRYRSVRIGNGFACRFNSIDAGFGVLERIGDRWKVNRFAFIFAAQANDGYANAFGCGHHHTVKLLLIEDRVIVRGNVGDAAQNVFSDQPLGAVVIPLGRVGHVPIPSRLLFDGC